jgi:TRAP-type transport system small permease protein
MKSVNNGARSIDAAITFSSRLLNIFAVTAISLMMAVSVVDIFMRFAFRSPILDSSDMVQYLMVVGGFGGLAWCALKDGHVRVDLLTIRLSSRGQAFSDSFGYFLCLTVVPLVAWQGFQGAIYCLQVNKASQILEIPAFPFYLIMGIGAVMLSLVLLTLLVKSIIKAGRR